MIDIVPFNPAHLPHIDLIDEERYILPLLEDEAYQELMIGPYSYTAIKDGVILGCGGLAPLMPTVARAWAVTSKAAGRNMLPLTRIVRRCLFYHHFLRIEILVLADFKAANRWARILGCELETPNGMKRYGINGETYNLYSKT